MLSTLRRLLGGERRVHARRRGGVAITVGDEDATVIDWSPGGFRIAALSASRPARGTTISGRVRVGRVSGPYTAYVVSVFQDGALGARYDEIDAKVFRALAEQM